MSIYLPGEYVLPIFPPTVNLIQQKSQCFVLVVDTQTVPVVEEDHPLPMDTLVAWWVSS